MFEKELQDAIEVVKQANELILKYYNSTFNVEIKSDNSPVTDADKASDELIIKYLKERYPNYAFLTEETPDDLSRLENDYVWIIDPLDGTKDFVAHDGEFTVNVALSYKHKAVVGVVGVPYTGEIYYASENNGSYVLRNNKIEKIHVNDKLKDLTCLCSVFHQSEKEKAVLKKYAETIHYTFRKGSSIKACYIAEGKAEVSFRFGEGTKEWDTAAFQIIVEEAGGLVLKFDKTPIRYNREDVYNHEGYVIMNDIKNMLI